MGSNGLVREDFSKTLLVWIFHPVPKKLKSRQNYKNGTDAQISFYFFTGRPCRKGQEENDGEKRKEGIESYLHLCPSDLSTGRDGKTTHTGVGSQGRKDPEVKVYTFNFSYTGMERANTLNFYIIIFYSCVLREPPILSSSCPEGEDNHDNEDWK